MSGVARAGVRVGVVGVGRGLVLARELSCLPGLRLVGLCDTRVEPLARAGAELGVATHDSYDALLDEGLDAVVLANDAQRHAPLAIRALERDVHVLSETLACKTLAEGVALCRAVERSGRIYALAENYPYSPACVELRRLYDRGEIGTVTYAEGEYNHPLEEGRRLDLSPGADHWRHWMPPTYYSGHALAPLLRITGARPTVVNAQAIVERPTQSPDSMRVADQGAVTLVRTDSGAVFRLLGLTLHSIHRVRFELHGERGLIATDGPDHRDSVRIHHEPWHRPESGEPVDRRYRISSAETSTAWVCRAFAESIRTGRAPELDVHAAVTIAAVGIQAWRSCLADGARYEVPDLRDERARRTYEHDHWSPFPEDAGPGQPPPSIRGLVEPARRTRDAAERHWRREPPQDADGRVSSE